MKKEKRQREEQVGERHYVMGQVIQVGPILCLILQKCHWNSILKTENTKILFSFSIIHIQNFEYLSHENNDPKLSQTYGHPWDPLGLDDGSWKLSDITQLSCYPNMLLNFDMGLGSALSCIESVKMQTSVKYLSRIYIPNGFCAKNTMNPSLAFFRYKISEGSHLKITYLFLGSI